MPLSLADCFLPREVRIIREETKRLTIERGPAFDDGPPDGSDLAVFTYRRTGRRDLDPDLAVLPSDWVEEDAHITRARALELGCDFDDDEGVVLAVLLDGQIHPWGVEV